MITRGTTPQITIHLPFPAAELTTGDIRFGQAGKTLFSRKIEECTAEEDKLFFFLEEHETMMLSHLVPVEAQIVATNQNGVIVASEIMEDEVGRVLEVENA